MHSSKLSLQYFVVVVLVVVVVVATFALLLLLLFSAVSAAVVSLEALVETLTAAVFLVPSRPDTASSLPASCAPALQVHVPHVWPVPLCVPCLVHPIELWFLFLASKDRKDGPS